MCIMWTQASLWNSMFPWPKCWTKTELCVHAYVRVCVRACVRVRACVHAPASVCMHACVRVHTHLHIYTQDTHIRTRAHTHTHTHTHKHTHTQVSLCHRQSAQHHGPHRLVERAAACCKVCGVQFLFGDLRGAHMCCCAARLGAVEGDGGGGTGS